MTERTEAAQVVARRSSDRWFEALRPACAKTSRGGKRRYGVDVVLFYLARWCQKKTGDEKPKVDSLSEADVRGAAERIVRNLAEYGATIDRLVDVDSANEWTALRRLLLASARSRAGDEAADFADEALQKIAVVLLTGTPPSRAAEQLALGPKGPRNEYIFTSPFEFWARSVVINLFVDEQRRAARQRRPPAVRAATKAAHLDAAQLEKARDALPALLSAIRALPLAQRSVLVLSLCRRDLDDLVHERLHQLAPDLFSEPGQILVSSDHDIAEHLGTTPRRVAANRSVARRKLARWDPAWELLLDVLLPHRSTRPIKKTQAVGASTAEHRDA